MITSTIDYLNKTASKYPDKIAFRDEHTSITFGMLRDKSRLLAGVINAALDARIKCYIAVFLPKSVECIMAFIATSYSGNCYTPIDVSCSTERIQKIIDILSPDVILTDSKHKEIVRKIVSSAIIINIEDTPAVDDAKIERALQNTIDVDPVYVMFTSGSTGIPKGVVISHRAVIDYTEWLAKTFAFNDTTVFGNQAPFYFDNSILDIYSTIKNGCEMVIIPERLFMFPKKLLTYIDKNDINTIFWVPSALSLVANSGVLEKIIPAKIKKVLFCGEVMQTKQFNIWRRALPNALYANLYGPTEITDVCTYYIIEREFSDEESLPIGFSCMNSEILLLKEDNQLAINGEIGELCVRGTCLSYGYLGDQEKTQAAFIQNPLNTRYTEKIYRTGDLAYRNGHGEIMYAGRRDFQIKHLGHRIELGEIETAVSANDDVKQCCALYDENKSTIVLFIAPTNIDKSELYQKLKIKIPSYMLPQRIETMDALPLNANGKIDRVTLKLLVEETS